MLCRCQISSCEMQQFSILDLEEKRISFEFLNAPMTPAENFYQKQSDRRLFVSVQPTWSHLAAWTLNMVWHTLGSQKATQNFICSNFGVRFHPFICQLKHPKLFKDTTWLHLCPSDAFLGSEKTSWRCFLATFSFVFSSSKWQQQWRIKMICVTSRGHMTSNLQANFSTKCKITAEFVHQTPQKFCSKTSKPNSATILGLLGVYERG